MSSVASPPKVPCPMGFLYNDPIWTPIQPSPPLFSWIQPVPWDAGDVPWSPFATLVAVKLKKGLYYYLIRNKS